jgi:DNA polymerase III delta prime subunit
MKTKLIINIFGGPGIGKSTTAYKLINYMKCNDLNVELAHEFAKDLIYEDKQDTLKRDQLYVFTEQHNRIYKLNNKVDYIITDSPLLLSPLYFNKKENIYSYKIFKELVLNTFKKYPNLNIILKRDKNKSFQKQGRIHTKNESYKIDQKIKNFLKSNKINYIELNPYKKNIEKDILNIIYKKTKQNPNKKQNI